METTSNNGDKSISLKSNDDDINGTTEEVEEDRLSSLPDVLLTEILSLLPIKSAAVTSALSQRWRRFWTQFTGDLLFSCFENPTRTSGFPDKVDVVIRTANSVLRQLLTSPNARSFNLNLPYSTNADHVRRYCSYFESWVCRICSRNPEKIAVTTYSYIHKPLVPLPSCLFQCESLIELVLLGLFGFDITNYGINTTISLPNLKKLEMHLYDDHRQLMATLFKSCPSLESLDLRFDWMEGGHIVDISAHNLKELKLIMRRVTPCNEILIDAPKLESFDVEGYITLYRFIKNPSGLLKARIVLFDKMGGSQREEDYVKQTLDLFCGVSSVRSLNMYAPKLNSLDDLDDNLLSNFCNLTCLSIHGRWKDFMRFLQWFPNLEDIKFRNDDDPVILEGLVGPVPVCFLSKLKRMEIVTEKGCSEALLNFLKYILSKASVLEGLLVNVFYHKEHELSNELKFCEDLFSHPGSSQTCKIEFFGLQSLSS